MDSALCVRKNLRLRRSFQDYQGRFQDYRRNFQDYRRNFQDYQTKKLLIMLEKKKNCYICVDS